MKKSVLSKVKEKARKWRNLLAKKKHGHDDDNPTPPWGVTLDEEDDEQDPEYHGAPSTHLYPPLHFFYLAHISPDFSREM